MNATPATLVSVAVTPPTASVPALVAQQFVATGTYSNGTTKAVTSDVNWTVGTPIVATVDTGLVTPLEAGTTTVTATDPTTGFSGTASLTVTTATLVSIAVTPGSKQIPIGTSQNFTATGTFSDGTKFALDPSSVSWTTTNDAVATVASAGGATGVNEGTVAVIATNPATGLSAQAILIVGTETLVSVSVTPATESIPKGLTQSFVATGIYSDDTTLNLSYLATWSSSATGIAKVSNAEGENGLATADGVGTATITAKIAGVSGTATLTVTAAVLESIAITPLTTSLPNGTTQQLTATGAYSDGTTKNITKTVTWTAALPDVVSVSNASGSIGLASALSLGAAIVIATDPTTLVSNTATLTVTGAVLKSLAVTPASVSVPLGSVQESYTATGTFTDLTMQNMTATVLWTSSTPAVATISNAPGSAGVATTASVGTTSITAFDPVSGINSKAATLKVTAAVLTSITISPPSATIPEGFGVQYTAAGTYSDGSSQNLTSAVTWKVAAGSATVSNAAGTAGLTSTTKAGLNTIQASSGSIKATAALTVTSATVASISVTPAAQSIALGTTQAYDATGIFTDGTKLNLTTIVTWADSNGDAVVSNVAGSNGVATATGIGLTTISATYAPTHVTGSTTLTVTPAALVSIAVTPATPNVPSGLTQQFMATGTFTDKSTQDLMGVTWSTSTPAVMTVSNATGSYGLGTALTPGITVVTATDPTTGIAGSATVNVTSAILVSIAITPSTANLPLGTSLQLTATGTYSDRSTQVLTSSVSWATSNGSVSVANVPAIPAGLATSVSVGPTVVTATDPASGISGTANLTATPAALVFIAVTPAAQSVPSGQTQQFSATGTYSDGSTMNLTQSATWSSSSASAVISNAAGSQGLASAGTLGSAVISATDPVTGIAGTALLMSTAAVLVAIDVTPPSPSMPAGLTSQLTATGIYSDGSSLNITSAVTWASSSPNAAVSNAAATTGLVTGLTAGSATVVATNPVTGISGQANVTVTAAVPAFLSVAPVSVNMLTGQTQQLTAIMTMTDGTQINETGSVAWISSSANVYVSTASPSYGMITAVSVGGASITATDPASGFTASATVSVALQTNDSAAEEFSPYVNPVGNWSFGGLSGSAFQLATSSDLDSAGDNAWYVPGAATVTYNGTGSYRYLQYQTDYYNYSAFYDGYSGGYGYLGPASFNGPAYYIPTDGLTLSPYAEAADARWMAPSSGVYTLTATFTGQSYFSSTPGSCLLYQSCCTPYCHGCGIGQCWCGDDYCDPYSYSACNPYYVGCTTLEWVYTTTNVSVNLNGAPLFSGSLNANGAGNTQTFTTTVSLNAGDTIDFAAAVGANGTPYGPDGRYADTTLLSAQVTGGVTCANPAPPGSGNLVGLSLSPTAANVTGAGTTPFQAVAYYSNQPSVPVNVTAQASWQASGSDLAVDANGNASYSGTNIATGSVTATFGALSASSAVRVWDPARVAQLQSLTLSSSPSFASNYWLWQRGDCATITDTASYSDGTSEDVTATTVWGGNEPVVFGNLLDIESGQSEYLSVTASLGTGLLTAPTTAQGLYVSINPTFNGTCSDPRIPGAAWQVFTSPAGGGMFVGQAALETASAYFADGSVRDVTPSAAWLACNPSVLDVATDGWVTGVAPGSGSALAIVGTEGALASFSVSPGPAPGNLTSLFIEPTANNLVNGGNFPARAIATYENLPGYMFNVTSQTTWSSSNPAVMGVTQGTGPTMITSALSLGSATVVGAFGPTAAGENIQVWDPARLAQLVSTAPNTGTEFPSCLGDQFSNIATFSDGTTQDVTTTTQWTPIGDDGYAFVSRLGYMSPIGNRQGYLEVQGSLGRGFVVPAAGDVGIFGSCPGPTCSDGVQDGFETDVDCGGLGCDPCASGQGCLAGTDCQSTVCVQLVCQ